MGGFLKNGKWVSAQHWETSADGAFQRSRSTFRAKVESNASAHHPLESGRYHLFVSRACPWAHRTLLVRALKGLEDAVTVSTTHPFMGDDGWAFGEDAGRPESEPLLGKRYLREVYLEADPDFTGRVTVPVLWDKKRHTIVNNESREILRMLDVVFHPLAARDVSLCPEDLSDAIDQTIEAIYGPINNGVYRAGFARTQQAYDGAFAELFSALDHWDGVLSQQRYLCGSELTEADLCLLTTLIRFDPVYYVHFKCNLRRIIDYKHLSGYVRELYQLPHVADTCDFDHIKRHYYQSHAGVNPARIVPRGPDLEWLREPHGRDRLPGGPPAVLQTGSQREDDPHSRSSTRQ